MPHHEQAVEASISHRRSLLVSYSEGAIPIPIPHNPSTPVARSKPSRCAPYQRLYTGPPVDPVEGYHTAPATSSKYQVISREYLLGLSSSYSRSHNYYPGLCFEYRLPRTQSHSLQRSCLQADNGKAGLPTARHRQTSGTPPKSPATPRSQQHQYRSRHYPKALTLSTPLKLSPPPVSSHSSPSLSSPPPRTIATMSSSRLQRRNWPRRATPFFLMLRTISSCISPSLMVLLNLQDRRSSLRSLRG
jgi:hypothetical protein